MRPKAIDVSFNFSGNLRPPQRPKILLIDDSQTVRQLISSFLHGKSYDVVVVSSGEEGLEKFKAEKFDAVILNEILPGMYGTVVADKIRNTNPHIPVFMVTGSDLINGNPKQVKEQHGITEIIPKTTLTTFLLFQALQATLNKKGTEKIMPRPVSPVTLPSVRPMLKPHVLVVDSSKTVCDMLKSKLEKMGFNVICAFNATDAWHIFKEGPEKFNLVITANFAGQDRGGIVLGNMVKALRPEIPVILHTSDEIKYLEARDIEIIHKSFLFLNLFQRVGQLFPH